MNYQKPIPTNATKDSVHAFAERVASGFQFGPGDPVEPLVGRLGGRIEYKNAVGFQSRLPESIIVDAQDRFTIFVPSMTSASRDRFTIAHELGHLFLHFPIVSAMHPGDGMIATRWVDQNDGVQQRAEWEANWFAAAFLMPSTVFRSSASLGVTRLAQRFGVSTQAIEVRAKTLGLHL